MAGGAISASGTVYVTYKYGLPTKPVVGEIVAIDGGQAYVAVYKQAMRAMNAAAMADN